MRMNRARDTKAITEATNVLPKIKRLTKKKSSEILRDRGIMLISINLDAIWTNDSVTSWTSIWRWYAAGVMIMIVVNTTRPIASKCNSCSKWLSLSEKVGLKTAIS